MLSGVYRSVPPGHHIKKAGNLSSSSSYDEVRKYLLESGIDDEIAENFKRNKVDGFALVKLTEQDIKRTGSSCKCVTSSTRNSTNHQGTLMHVAIVFTLCRLKKLPNTVLWEIMELHVVTPPIDQVRLVAL